MNPPCINLLPHRAARRALQQRQWVALQAVAVLCALVLTLAGWGWHYAHWQRQQQANALVEQALARLAPQLEEERTLQQELQSGRQRHEKLLQWRASWHAMLRLLEALGAGLPAGLYLTQLEYSQGQLVLQGQASGHEAVQQLKAHLEQQVAGRNVLLDGMQDTQAETQQFRLVLVPPAAPASAPLQQEQEPS